MLPPKDREQRVSEQIRTARVRRTPAGFAVTLTALAILFVVFYAFVLKPAPSVTTPALASAAGRFVYTEHQVRDGATVSTTTIGSFVLSSDGSATVEAVVANDGLSFERAGDHRWAYDAGERETLHLVATTAGRQSADLDTGMWPPRWRVGAPTPVDFQGDAAIVRSAVEDGDETIGIKPVIYQGREAWRASWRSGSWLKDLVVDRGTGLVVWYSLNGVQGEDGVEYRVEELRIDEPPAAGAFDTTPPAGARLESFESGDPEIVGGLDEAAERLGVALPRSTLDPDGYELVAVGVGQIRSAPAVWVAPRTGSPRSDGLTLPGTTPNTAVLLYAKGLSSYTIEIVAGGSWTTPIDPGWNDLFGRLTVELQYGMFAGRTAQTWYGDGPTAVVWNDGYAVRVYGGLTRTEAISILDGLEF